MKQNLIIWTGDVKITQLISLGDGIAEMNEKNRSTTISSPIQLFLLPRDYHDTVASLFLPSQPQTTRNCIESLISGSDIGPRRLNYKS